MALAPFELGKLCCSDYYLSSGVTQYYYTLPIVPALQEDLLPDAKIILDRNVFSVIMNYLGGSTPASFRLRVLCKRSD